jgi:ABC-2 type transport system permease protein
VTVRVALVIAGKDLRQRIRDRSALVLGFVAPLAIAALMSFAFTGTESFHVDVAVVDGDHSELSAAFIEVLGSPGLSDVLTVQAFAEESAAATALDGGDVQAAIVIPFGFAAAATQASGPLAMEVLTSIDYTLAGQVARSVTEAFVAQVNADRLSVTTALAAGAPLDQLGTLAAEAAELELPAATVQRPSGDRPLKPISYFAPGMGIFFVLFAVGFGARGWFLEQRAGTLERMAAAARPSQILLGKALSVFAYGIASLATIAVSTTLLFGADWGGPLPAAALIVAMVTAVVALTALVTLVARTERQAEGVASIVTFTLALLGGNFIFVSSAPPLLRRLSLLTPNGWALRGFVDLSTGERSLATAAQPVAAILAFAAVIGLLTAVLSRRVVDT